MGSSLSWLGAMRLKTQARLALAYLTTVICAMQFSTVGMDAKPYNQSDYSAKIKFKCLWYQDEKDDESALHPLTAQISEGLKAEGVLTIFKEGKPIFRFEPHIYPDSMFVLQDGNLATQWFHGNGTKHIYVFANSNGSVRRVLDASSKLPPEYVFLSKGRLAGEGVEGQDGKWRIKGGPFLKQSILTSKVDWVARAGDSGNHSELRPISATRFTWNTKSERYEAIENVPWEKRFDAVP